MKDVIEKAKAAIEREDYAVASDLLRPLAEHGAAEAEFLMGYLYFSSAPVTKDESRSWLERAAAKDHPEALYYLSGLGHTVDFGPPEDDAHGRFLIRAAELGLPRAQRDLGCFYSIGEGGFPKDSALGRLWYGRAATQGHADAQYNFGLMLLHGEGGPAEPDAGIEWIHRAAKQGDKAAIHFLSDCPK